MSNCDVKRSYSGKLKSENDSLVSNLAKRDLEPGQSAVRIKNSTIDTLTSRFTGDTYDIYISYPGNYEKSKKKYPVLVVLDAEVNFGAISYITQRLIKDKLIPELLVVGVAFQGETDEDTYYSLRCRDYTPTIDKAFEQAHKNYKSGSGGAENFAKFLSLELFPYLTSHYPIKTTDKTIYGHSFGGLFGVYMLKNHPALFDNYLLLSPSLWWDDKTGLRI